MLNIDYFRKIKPIDSADDWESGTGYIESPQERSKRVRDAVYKVLSDKGPISINEIIRITGASQGGTHNIMAELLKSKLVTCVKRKSKTGKKKTGYFSLVA